MQETSLSQAEQPTVSHEALIEVSTGFHPDHLADFLWRLVPLIQEDFAEAQVHRLIRIADQLKLEDASQVNLTVTFNGRRVPIRVILYRYEEKAVGFFLKAPWPLAKLVHHQMKTFYSVPQTWADYPPPDVVNPGSIQVR